MTDIMMESVLGRIKFISVHGLEPIVENIQGRNPRASLLSVPHSIIVVEFENTERQHGLYSVLISETLFKLQLIATRFVWRLLP